MKATADSILIVGDDASNRERLDCYLSSDYQCVLAGSVGADRPWSVRPGDQVRAAKRRANAWRQRLSLICKDGLSSQRRKDGNELRTLFGKILITPVVTEPITVTKRGRRIESVARGIEERTREPIWRSPRTREVDVGSCDNCEIERSSQERNKTAKHTQFV
jgi:hypothetical protein